MQWFCTETFPPPQPLIMWGKRFCNMDNHRSNSYAPEMLKDSKVFLWPRGQQAIRPGWPDSKLHLSLREFFNHTVRMDTLPTLLPNPASYHPGPSITDLATDTVTRKHTSVTNSNSRKYVFPRLLYPLPVNYTPYGLPWLVWLLRDQLKSFIPNRAKLKRELQSDCATAHNTCATNTHTLNCFI